MRLQPLYHDSDVTRTGGQRRSHNRTRRERIPIADLSESTKRAKKQQANGYGRNRVRKEREKDGRDAARQDTAPNKNSHVLCTLEFVGSK